LHKGNQSVDGLATRKTGYMDDGFLSLIKEISNIMDGFVPKKKTKLFTFDSHYTAFSACENAVEMTVGNPMPGGTRKRCSIFFLKNEGKHYFFALGRVSLHPQPRARFSKSPPAASANQRPRTTACGLHPVPLKCLVAWALTLKIVPWAGGVGSAADVWRCK
jgi:hypothetical protein